MVLQNIIVIRLERNEGLSSRVETARSTEAMKVFNRSANHGRKEISSPYIVILQIRQEIILFVATIVHLLQRLDDSNPKQGCLLQHM
jgi:hypothetical protein